MNAGPIRISLAQMPECAHTQLIERLRAFSTRVEVLPWPDSRCDLVLVDPYASGLRFDVSRLDPIARTHDALVIYTDGAAIDDLAFAMAGSVLEGRLRGWLGSDLGDDALVEGLEQIHAGSVVIRRGSDSVLPS